MEPLEERERSPETAGRLRAEDTIVSDIAIVANDIADSTSLAFSLDLRRLMEGDTSTACCPL
jgi:hypothetical protein